MREFFSSIMEIKIIYCTVVALAVPVVLLAAGGIVWLIKDLLAALFELMEPGGAQLADYVTFPGVVIHELAHFFVAKLTGAYVVRLELFHPQGNTLGSCAFLYRGGPFLRSVQRIFIASAPVYVGVILEYELYHLLLSVRIPYKILLVYLMASILYHMEMSREDAKLFFPGIPAFAIGLFLIAWNFLY